MPPLTKHRFSHGRTHRRRAHDALTLPQLIECPHCKTPRLAHQVCPSCGFYKGVEVVKQEAKDKKKPAA
ncbi:MAG: 50S ribosomal protein L32 [Anaerolineae bacterium]|jgi:large subunit ribosomal protein L32|uniref:50S ribosomal protein L32 n=1 Tax=Candidatus Amarolinea dominans TaxID=3140696 RepID=UPI001D588797|nr:50S ribosomal protein L32 [Anaerolineae bacterium]MBK7201544.1 50S ribosomal protein L32 [Anaerolineae bacterium]MBK9231535.1 50S ribosomal protein L32 [Anaerolineae bacterium]